MNNIWLIKNYEDKFPFESLIKDRNLSFEKNKEFLNSSDFPLKDPFIIKGMDETVDIILNAISENKRIIFYGDYDVDGVSAVSILYLALKNINEQGFETYDNFDYFIPKREDGYGLTKESVDKVINMGAEVIVTVDCGITNIDEVEYIKENDIEIVVTDHHNCKEVLPNADAIINPKQQGCFSNLQCLCGAGIAYYISRALFLALGLENEPRELLEIATIATVADMVNLQGENRILVSKGLKLLQNPSNLGLNSLLHNINNNNAVDSTFIAFNIAPILNSAGRMHDAELSVKLLLSDSTQQADDICVKLINLNFQRKEIEREIFQIADLQAKNQGDNNIIVTYGDDWHCGVSGIIASKITEKYIKPSIVISFDQDGIGKGSVRSVPGINILKLISNSSQYLVKFGGHNQAAGITIEKQYIESFIEQINSEYSKYYDESYEKVLEIDAIINKEDINFDTIKKLEQLEPFGVENQKPVFCIQNIKLLKPIAIGKNNEHFKCYISIDNNMYEVISFYNYEKLSKFNFEEEMDIVFQMDINSFNGNDRIQLNLKDIKYSYPKSNLFEKTYKSLKSILNNNTKNKYYTENTESIEKIKFRDLNEFSKEKTLILTYSSNSNEKIEKLVNYLYVDKIEKSMDREIEIILFPIIEKIDFSLYNNVIISYEHHLNIENSIEVIKQKNPNAKIFLLEEEILKEKEDLSIRSNMIFVYNLLKKTKKGSYSIDDVCNLLNIKYINLIVSLILLKDLSFFEYDISYNSMLFSFEMNKNIQKSILEENKLFIKLEEYFSEV